MKPQDLPSHYLPVQQPWACFVAHNLKSFVTLNSDTASNYMENYQYRGDIGIYAMTAIASRDIEDLYIDLDLEQPASMGRFEALPANSIIAIATIVDFLKITKNLINSISELEWRCGCWDYRRYAIELNNIRKIEPVPLCKRMKSFEFKIE